VTLRATFLLALAYVLLLALIALGVPLAISLRDRVDAEVRGQARSQADVVAATASELIGTTRSQRLQRLLRVSAASVRGRVIAVNRNGVLVADSAGPAPPIDYSSRPEIRSALNGRGVQISRDSKTLGEEILATSAPVLAQGRPAGAIRVTQSVAAVSRAVHSSIVGLAILAGVVLLLGLIAGAIVAQRLARPIRRLDDVARTVAGGDLGAAAPVEGSKEQRSLARSFNEMTERVRRLLRVQQDFVADASHQLRTPLTGLWLRLEGLSDRFQGDRAARRELDAGMREIDRLSQIVDELLVLSRAGEHELPGERILLGEAIRQAAERWQPAAAERELEIRVSGGDGEAAAWIAGPDLARALDALVENALRYSPPGSTVSLASAGNRIEVRDEGPGLAAGEEETVFERFSRGEAGRHAAAGTGLGLPIARELTRQWGGDVVLANRPEGGLRATIEVPVPVEEAAR
jgi:two-component system, OmpR family, sensor kinase